MGSAVKDEFDLAGHSLSDRYDIERVVAAGGFGVVYFGRHRALKSPIAVKVLRTPKDLTEAEEKDFAERFLAEAQTIAELQHSAVVRAMDFGVTPMPNGKIAPWTVFEWVEGQTLKDYLDARRGSPMAPREALALLKPVFEGLAAAHARGIAHRDVKPANIMLPEGTSGLASRILDFGIAKTMHPDESPLPTGQTRTRSSASGFSLLYASPEQIGNTRTGPWTDVHALALVLTEALVGHAVLQGNDFVDIAATVLAPQRPTPQTFGVDVGEWEPVIARAMAMKPLGRYANAAEFLAALEESAPYDPLPTNNSGELRRSRALSLGPSKVGDSTFRPSQVPVPPPAVDTPRSRWILIAVSLVVLFVAGLAVKFSRASREPEGMHAASAQPLPTPPRPEAPAVVQPAAPAVPEPRLAPPDVSVATDDASAAAPLDASAAPAIVRRVIPRSRRDVDAGARRPQGPVELAPNL